MNNLIKVTVDGAKSVSVSGQGLKVLEGNDLNRNTVIISQYPNVTINKVGDANTVGIIVSATPPINPTLNTLWLDIS